MLVRLKNSLLGLFSFVAGAGLLYVCRFFGGFFLLLASLCHHEHGAEDTDGKSSDTGKSKVTRVKGRRGRARGERVFVALPVEIHAVQIFAVAINLAVVQLHRIFIPKHMETGVAVLGRFIAALSRFERDRICEDGTALPPSE